MQLSGRSDRFLLFFLIFLLCHHELNAITQLDKERIELGVKAASSLASAMKALKFVDWVMKIGKVAGPLMSIASIALDIVFMFLDIESPELTYMKEEFQKLNTRMDEFSEKFQDVKKQIDWSAIKINYESYESAIRVMSEERLKITNAKTASQRDSAIRTYIRKYENDFPMVTEKFYYALVEDTGLTKNIFVATRDYTDRHPENSFKFMKGCVQLLLQSFMIEGTYIRLKYNNSMADQYFTTLTDHKMKEVSAKATEVYNAMVNVWHDQMQKDVRRIALTNRQMSHEDFIQKLFYYLSGKYIQRRWFVRVYNPIESYEKHAAYVCNGGLFFRLGGRNIVIASNLLNGGHSWSKSWASSALGFGQLKQNDNGAEAVLDEIRKRNGDCSPAAAVTVVGNEGKGYFMSSSSRRKEELKSVKWCNDPLCWLGGVRYYSAVVFG